MIQSIVKGLAFGLLLSISVGPVLFSIIKQSLNNGHKGGLFFVSGVSASDIALVLLVNYFTTLFDEIKKHEQVIGLVGCAFLVTLGIYFLFFKKVHVNEAGKQVLKTGHGHYIRIFLSGFFMNTLNPSVFLFWIYASTAVVDHTLDQRIIIFVTCLSWMLSTDILKVFLAGKIRKKLTPHNIHIINRINGAILIVFGVALIWGLLFYGKKL
jgi:threonine/homoserine/homoserine lactone efflux protein